MEACASSVRRSGELSRPSVPPSVAMAALFLAMGRNIQTMYVWICRRLKITQERQYRRGKLSGNVAIPHCLTTNEGTYSYMGLEAPDEQRALLSSTRVGFSDSGTTLYLIQGGAKPVPHGPNSTESNLFNDGESAYRVG